MNEEKRILLEKIARVLYWIVIVIVGVLYFYMMAVKPFSKETILLLIFLFFIPFFIVMVFIRLRFLYGGFRGKTLLNSNIYEFHFDNQQELLEKIKRKCHSKGYAYEHYLKTNLDEEYYVYASDGNEFPKEKIGVYISDVYECETQSDYEPSRYSSKPSIVPGQGNFHFEYKPYLNMICGKWGRDYQTPRDWVGIETTLLVIVDEWNGMLNNRLNHSGHLPFVLFCVIVKNEPGKLFISKDIRKDKRDDYNVKLEELFDILDVENRSPIGEMRYKDRELLKLKLYNERKTEIEERHKRGIYYY